MKMKHSIIFTAILLSLANIVLSQGNQAGLYDYPCDPDGPVGDPAECQSHLHLTCISQFTHYSNGTCRCATGSYWHLEGLYRCRVGANQQCTPGGDSAPCTTFATCKIPNGGSPTDPTVCECNEGTYQQPNGPYCVVSRGTPCSSAAGQIARCDSSRFLTCSETPDPEDINGRICACAGSNVWSETRAKCLGSIETSSSCSVNDDCVDNAVCRRSDFGIARCHCAPGYSKNLQNTCSLAYGATCDPSQGAAVKCNDADLLECSSTTNTCQCADGRLLIPGTNTCVGVANHACKEHRDCGGGTLCHDLTKKCFCSQSFGNIELLDRTCGRLGRAGYCRMENGYDDCFSSEYLHCVPVQGAPYGRCECDAGLITDDAGRCIQLAGATCSSSGNQNCVPNAACILGLCTCLPGTAQTTDGRCLMSYDQPCDSNPNTPDNRCNTEQGLYCAATKCACPVGQEWNEARGHCVALVSGTCTQGANYCTENAGCTLGFCQCAQGYVQRSPDDRRCAPSHGTACDPDTASCSPYQFLTCPTTTRQCTCEFPTHQTWDASRGQCTSILGGRCGLLEENEGRELQCVETSSCLMGADFVTRCACDEENGREPDGQGKCRQKVEPTTTTTIATTTLPTTTTNTPAPTPTPTPTTTTTTTPPDDDDDDDDSGAIGSRVGTGAILLLLGACAFNMIV